MVYENTIIVGEKNKFGYSNKKSNYMVIKSEKGKEGKWVNKRQEDGKHISINNIKLDK